MKTITITLQTEDTSILIPKSQTEIIKEALKYYRSQYEKFNSVPTESESYKVFDLRTLEALMNYDISIDISENNKNKFSFNHGIDFPEYI
jgi:hypothetical protein